MRSRQEKTSSGLYIFYRQNTERARGQYLSIDAQEGGREEEIYTLRRAVDSFFCEEEMELRGGGVHDACLHITPGQSVPFYSLTFFHRMVVLPCPWSLSLSPLSACVEGARRRSGFCIDCTK